MYNYIFFKYDEIQRNHLSENSNILASKVRRFKMKRFPYINQIKSNFYLPTYIATNMLYMMKYTYWKKDGNEVK